MAGTAMTFPRLEGKNVLVTGASAGIGAATAVLFARSGSNVTLAARRADKLREIKALCEKAYKEGGHQRGGGNFTTVEADLSKVDTIDAAWPELRGKKLDILINNAGGVRGRENLGDVAPEDVATMMDLNVTSLIHLTQLALKEFKKQNSGHILMLGSIAGREAYAGGSIYCATKAAVRSLTRSLIYELYNTPIRISEIQPGAVETEFSVIRFRGDQSKADAVYEGYDPLTPEDVAEEILWCASRPPHVNICELWTMPIAQGGTGSFDRSQKSR